ncbi:hypothetical protein C9374_005942 [Naegleria lovaniensis]|uniref:Uncharacterized protein n=1 Tax=Naegleria lovaniensis TaxID=51637 RepID=A0AA88KJ92_NAELO|nr:uncharacterized protein C9374_005942 [Naegleria lovaniensis]KAG2381558.1 hypothetical protein C9374_005942 [Naegleria lovaniensis]
MLHLSQSRGSLLNLILLISSMMMMMMTLTSHVHSHLCVFNPKQRGALNISDYGDPTCFKFAGPCGSSYAIDLQQNLNHYSIGHPGFLDVSIGAGENPTPEQFQVLSLLTDYYPVRQWTRTNFSIPFTLEAQGSVGRHVIRVRYHPNKPTEPVFHQCIDVVVNGAESSRTDRHDDHKKVNIDITPSLPEVKVEFNEIAQRFFEKKNMASPAVSSEMLFALVASNSKTNPIGLNLVGVDIVSGQVVPVLSLPNLVGTDQHVFQQGSSSKIAGRIVNSVSAVDNQKKRIFYLMNTDTSLSAIENFNSAADAIFVYEHATNSYSILKINVRNVPFNATSTIDTLYISGLNYVNKTNSLLATALIVPDSTRPRDTYLALFNIPLDSSSLLQPKLVAKSAQPQGAYVDFLWSTYDDSSQTASILIRHEDEPLALLQRIYSVSLNQISNTVATLPFIQVDPSQFAYSSIHSYKNQLFAFSPGSAQNSLPVSASNTWNLIGVDSKSGQQSLINEMYEYRNYLGGGVVSAVSNTGRGIYNVMQSTDGKNQIIVRVALHAIPINPITEVATVPMTTRIYNWVRMDTN